MEKIPLSMCPAQFPVAILKRSQPLLPSSPPPPPNLQEIPTRSPSNNKKFPLHLCHHLHPQLPLYFFFPRPQRHPPLLPLPLPSPLPLRCPSFLRHLLSPHTPYSFSPSHSTFCSLLSHSCLSPDPHISPFLSLMFSHSLPPDPSSVDVSVRALCSASRPDHATRLLLSFPAPQTTSTYNFLIHLLMKSQPISSVFSIIDSLCPRVQPNLVTYTILVDSVCRSKNLREATRLLKVLDEC